MVLKELIAHGLVDGGAMTVHGRTLSGNAARAECFNRDVIRPYSDPFKAEAGIATLRGNLCPGVAVIRPSAASPHLMRHTGRAVVFCSIEDLHARIDDEALEIDATSVMVLQNCGPKGCPGMAEVGNMPLPPKLLRAGMTDMIRISDLRMSGSAYGTVVLDVVPEAAAGGPLALVRTGDPIALDLPARSLAPHVEDATLAARRAASVQPPPAATRGYTRLYVDHVLQADEGADIDFLKGCSGAPVARDNH